MNSAALSGLLAGYGIAIPVGAISVLLVNLGSRTPLRVGTAAGLGAATVDGAFALIAVLGGAGLAREASTAAGPLRWAGAAVLAVLAARTLLAAVRSHRVRGSASRQPGGLTSPLRAYTGLVGLTALNPVTLVYFGALVVSRQAAGGFAAAQAAIFVLCVFAASASWQLLLVTGGAMLGRVLGSPRGRLATSAVSSALILALAVGIVAGLLRRASGMMPDVPVCGREPGVRPEWI